MLTPLRADQWDLGKAAHLLNRAGFGGSPAEIEALHQLGLDKAVDRLLDGPDDSEVFPPPKREEEPDYAKMRMEMQGLSEQERQEKRRLMFRDEHKYGVDLQEWWLNRMRKSPNPLREKMTLFWHGHFATSMQKVRRAGLLLRQNETLRRNALGSFHELVKEISRDPAMMFYLDTQLSKKDHPNENFARELMELFTLGIGNYTEQDIQQAARAFTGYRINPSDGSFFLAPAQADNGSKTFFGKTGNFTGDEIIAMILEKPACSLFITKKIWSFFSYENPSRALNEALAMSFRLQKYAIRPLMREVFRSAEFYSPAAIRTQIKSPIQWMIGTSKILENELPRGQVMINTLRQLGQVPLEPPNVKGWDGGKAWITTSTLLLRYNLANFSLGQAPITLAAPRRPTPPSPVVAPSPTVASNAASPVMREPKMATDTKPMEPQERGREVRNSTPPDFQKIVPQEFRSDSTKLVEYLCWRLYQIPIPPSAPTPKVTPSAGGTPGSGKALAAAQPSSKYPAKLAFLKEVEQFLQNHPAPVNDQVLRELLHLMMSTPQYQIT